MFFNTKGIAAELRGNFAALSNKNGFARNSLTLTIGTSVAQGIPILLAPVLARLFSPDDFGLFAVVSSVTAIISVISTGKYESVIVIARTRKNAVNLAALSLYLSFLTSLITFILLLAFSGTLVRLLHQPGLKYLIFISPLTSFMISVYLVYNEWSIRNGKFAVLSLNKVINSVSISFSNLFFGFLRLASGGLIWGEFMGRFISAMSCGINVVRNDIADLRYVGRKKMFYLARKYDDCPKFILPGQFLNTFGGQIIVVLITAYFGGTEAGYYSMTSMVLSVPTSIISTAIRDVFRQRAAIEFKLHKNCFGIFKRLTLLLSVSSFLIFGILFFILPWLFAFVLGEQWRIAGEYARILSPMVFISFISESVFGVFIVAEKMKAVLFWQSSYFIINVSSLVLGYYIFRDIKMALICFTAGKSFVHLLGLAMSYRFAKG